VLACPRTHLRGWAPDVPQHQVHPCLRPHLRGCAKLGSRPHWRATPSHFRHPPDPLAQASPQHAAAQLDPGMQGTNLYVDFVDVSEDDQPSPHRTQTAQHSAHSVHSIPMANAVIHPTTGANMEYRGLIAYKVIFHTWDHTAVNELGRLAQVVGGRIEGSNTISFIPRSAVPPNKTFTDGRFFVDVRLNKEEFHRVRRRG
jgi:hypothetical protein